VINYCKDVVEPEMLAGGMDSSNKLVVEVQHIGEFGGEQDGGKTFEDRRPCQG